MKMLLLLVLSFCLLAAGEKPELMSPDFAKLSSAEIERRLPDEHPANYYLYAGRLWAEGKNDDAVFWLYAGQLRFRFHLLANPNLPTSGDLALFSSLQATLGEPINLYAGGDLKKWMEQIDRVLKWDAKMPNGFTSKKAHSKELEDTRAGLVKLRENIDKNQIALRAQREAAGIGEVGVVNGVYVEVRKRKMPKDWPALAPETSLAEIAGSYEASFDALLGPIFFFEDQYNVLPAKSFVLTAAGPDLLLVVAMRGGEELLRRTIAVRREAGAVVFNDNRTAKQVGLEQGDSQGTVLMRLNVSGDLVIQRTSVTQGTRPNKPMPVRLEYTFWNSAKRMPSSASSVVPGRP